jgi:hypothetical protein
MRRSIRGVPAVAGLLVAALIGFGSPAVAADETATVAAPAVTTTSVSVPATQPWTDTGIDVSGAVEIQASGTISVGGPEGDLSPAGSQTGCFAGPASFSGQWVANGFPCWSLIGQVGNNQPFEVGVGGKFIVPLGRLYLGVDDEVSAFGDNSGAWTANVTPVQPQPGNPTWDQIVQVGLAILDWTLAPWNSLTANQKACILGNWDNCMQEPTMQAIMGAIDPAVWKRVLETEFGWIRDALTPDQIACLEGDASACSRL